MLPTYRSASTPSRPVPHGFKRAVRTGVGLQVGQNAQINITLDVGAGGRNGGGSGGSAACRYWQRNARRRDREPTCPRSAFERPQRARADAPEFRCHLQRGADQLRLRRSRRADLFAEHQRQPELDECADARRQQQRAVSTSARSVCRRPSMRWKSSRFKAAPCRRSTGLRPAARSISSPSPARTSSTARCTSFSATTRWMRETRSPRAVCRCATTSSADRSAGPIIKNRTFGFVNFEEYQASPGTPRISTVPIGRMAAGQLQNFRTAQGQLIPIYDPATTRPNPSGQGQIRDPFPGNIIPTSRFDPITRANSGFLAAAESHTESTRSRRAQNFEDQSLTRMDWTQSNFRVDHRFSSNATRSSSVTRTRRHQTAGNSIFTDPTVGQDREDDQINRNVMVSDTHTFSPTLINNLRVGVMRQAFDLHGDQRRQGLADASSDCLPIVPRRSVPADRLRLRHDRRSGVRYTGSLNWDIQETLTWIVGAHTLKFGYNHRILRAATGKAPRSQATTASAGLDQQSAGAGRHWLQPRAVPARRSRQRAASIAFSAIRGMASQPAGSSRTTGESAAA